MRYSHRNYRSIAVGVHILQRTSVDGTTGKTIIDGWRLLVANVDGVPHCGIAVAIGAVVVRRMHQLVLASQRWRTLGRLVDAQRRRTLLQSKRFECPVDYTEKNTESQHKVLGICSHRFTHVTCNYIQNVVINQAAN